MSDVYMGAISGFDVLDFVQRALPGTPVVLTSTTDAVRDEALERGASAFLAKADTTAENFAESIWRAARDSPRFAQTEISQRFHRS